MYFFFSSEDQNEKFSVSATNILKKINNPEKNK
jgi:hypothetical protein